MLQSAVGPCNDSHNDRRLWSAEHEDHGWTPTADGMPSAPDNKHHTVVFIALHQLGREYALCWSDV